LFVSYNPGLVGTKPLPQSFKDRFFPIQVPFFSEYQLGRILTAHGMPEGTDWGTFITKFGVTLWEAHTRGQLRYQVTSRRLQDAVELMLSGVVDNPREAIRQAVIAAIDSSIEAKVAETVLDQQRWSVY
jgi:MoxR-like ATPase